MELINLVSGTLYAYKNVEKWAKTEVAPFNVNFFAMDPRIRKEPKGTVLIIGPFNFPLWSLLSPLVSLSLHVLVARCYSDPGGCNRCRKRSMHQTLRANAHC
jgi:hypothetical protein